MRWSSFVAIGDSFTEGMDDALPTGEFRGWADLVAARLAQEGELRYANLAVRGKLFDAVVEDQVPAALRMSPDLISFAAGGNDVLRRKVDLPAMIDRFDGVVRMLRASGADVMLFQFADFGARLPGKTVMGPRSQMMNDAIRATAERHGAILLGMQSDAGLRDPRFWSKDRLHLNTVGHQRVAAHALQALGMSADPVWSGDLPPAERQTWLSRRREDAQWTKNYLLPWVGRRLAGRSSGDGRSPKRPLLSPLADRE